MTGFPTQADVKHENSQHQHEDQYRSRYEEFRMKQDEPLCLQSDRNCELNVSPFVVPLFIRLIDVYYRSTIV